MRKVSLFLLFLFFSIITHAYEVEVDGIIYNLIEKAKVAEVCGVSSNNKKDHITIPHSITVDGNIFEVTSISNSAFRYNSYVKSIDIPESITSIKDYAFANTSALEYIIIPENIESIEYCTFRSSSLKSVTLSNGIKKIGISAFENCTNLKSVVIPESVTSIGDAAFRGCTNLELIDLPHALTKISPALFSGCTNLKSFTVPDNITSINASAFSNCTALESLNIGKNVLSISSTAFYRCQNLKDVYCFVDKEWFAVEEYSSNYPNIFINAFSESYVEYATLHVPQSAINYYKTTLPWKDFGTIVSLEEGEELKCEKPRIKYNNGKLSFESDTEGAEFIYEIKDSDIKKGYEAEVDLNMTYNITVYAFKSGYTDSEVAKATLCWIDVDPKTEGITSSATSISARPIFIQNNVGDLLIKGACDELITIYDLSGKKVGEGKSIDDNIVIKTCLQKGNIAIINIGGKSLKLMIQ